ncbi:MAG: class I SAM-dependent rRNA methyltransferase, partial [Armatimonadota bacterium]
MSTMLKGEPTGKVVVKPEREDAVKRRHPWLFSGSVVKIEGKVQPGDVVDVVSQNGTWLARGFVNPQSEVPVRIATWESEERLDEEWLWNRLQQAWQKRKQLGIVEATDAFRVVYAESDFLPGIIVDCYAEFVVVQIYTPAMEKWRETLAEFLTELVHPKGIFERSDFDTRLREKLVPRVGPIKGDAPPEQILITEHGLKFLVDVWRGHKTGFYLDQRENRVRSEPYLRGERVLNAFSYTGSFALYAIRAGAKQVINLDTSSEALRLAEENAAINGFAGSVQSLEGNAFQLLRQFRDAGEQFDAIILDPPRFAPTKATVPNALRGYKDINLLAMRLLKPGGFLVTFSCSGMVSAEMFQQVLFEAALDAKREVLILERLTQSRDHPILATFPESEYLK